MWLGPLCLRWRARARHDLPLPMVSASHRHGVRDRGRVSRGEHHFLGPRAGELPSHVRRVRSMGRGIFLLSLRLESRVYATGRFWRSHSAGRHIRRPRLFFTQFKMRLEAASIQIGGRPRDNSQQYRRNTLKYYFRNASEHFEFKSKSQRGPHDGLERLSEKQVLGQALTRSEIRLSPFRLHASVFRSSSRSLRVTARA
jgi:hypothetical protein